MEPNPSLILIVDDDLDNQEVVSAAMKKAGYQVRKAVDLEQARGVMGKVHPDLVILDRNLPDGDGLEFCIEIRNKPSSANVPILFLSVRDSEKEKVLGLDHGADDYLPKPFGVKELQARVLALLRRSNIKKPLKGDN